MRSKEHIITAAMLLLITYTLSLSCITQAFPEGQESKTISSTGTIQIQTTTNIGIYHDVQCFSPLTSVAWGTLQPGESQSIYCYIKNEGTSIITLSLETSNWSPSSASDYLALNWNYANTPIDPDQVIQIVLTLSAASNIEGVSTFGFDITIVGTG